MTRAGTLKDDAMRGAHYTLILRIMLFAAAIAALAAFAYYVMLMSRG